MIIAAIAIAGAAISATITATAIATRTTNTTPTAAPPAPPAVTVTAAPTSTPAPAPLPTAQADQQTCGAGRITNDLIHAGVLAVSVIPEDMTVIDPRVQENREWSAAAIKAGDLYGHAADTLEPRIAPGTTPVLAQIADTSVSALRTLSLAYKSFDEASGNAATVMSDTRQAMEKLCDER